MSRLLIFMILSIIRCSSNPLSVEEELVVLPPNPSNTSHDICVDFNLLNNKIRDGKISRTEALKEMQRLLPQIKNHYYKQGGQNIETKYWVFPVQGYSAKAVGGTNGSGYIEKGYDYFDGNKHGGHPAHDIFIMDKHQDGVDDISKHSVNVLSMTGGIVVASEIEWDTTSNLRGGKYIWIYDPSSNSFFYYAHNSNVLVKPCDILIPGDTIATIGRTGLNAFKKRSPTHLHIMQLKLDSNYLPKSINCYKYLLSSKKQ